MCRARHGDRRVYSSVRLVAASGVDAVQALVLALHLLPAELRAIAREESGSFLNGDEDLGAVSRVRHAFGVTAWPADGPQIIHMIGTNDDSNCLCM